MSPIPAKEDKINVVGAGVFGLSTALHLASRGYKNVTVFDKQPYDRTLYSYFNGCDAASADMNKIIRSAYGSQTEYMELTQDALAAWKTWNDELAAGKTVPPGMTPVDRVFLNTGHLMLADGDTLPPFELASIDNANAMGLEGTQLITTDPAHIEIAIKKGFASAIDPFRRKDRNKTNLGVLGTTGGIAIADKACQFALHKARTLGVQFVLDSLAGSMESLCYEGNQVIGIRTKDGIIHPAAMTILACGGWTPSLLPSLDGLCETTAGSVVLLPIPSDSSLFDRFAPEKFPCWQYKMRDGAQGGLYGFPRDERGWLKIGYRGTKYTNPVQQADGKERSIPVTRWTENEQLKAIPKQALSVIEKFLDEFLPELKAEGISISFSRVCWYTDTFDNHFVIDRVPETEGLMVATGGSGHAFKYLPNIGHWVADIMEGVGLERPVVKAWRWRTLQLGERPINLLMEGRKGPRALCNVALTSDFELQSERAKL